MSFVKEITNHNGKKFQLHEEMTGEGFHYLLALPEQFEEGKSMVVETYNSQGKSQPHYKDNVWLALNKGNSIENILVEAIEDAPIIMPIVPDMIHSSDCQQMSKEAVEQELIDIRVLHTIKSAKDKIKELTGKNVGDKIFLNGYSASGVFAQRFALAHPEIIDRCLIGGAAGTIPIPTKELEYPLGIADYEKLFAKPFDREAYKSIQFGYYVAENEEREAGSYDIDGAEITNISQIPAPMHDMSFRILTTPYDVGVMQREIFGKTMDERFQNAIKCYQEMGIDISAIILRDANHAGIFNSTITRTAPYLKEQMLKFYYDGEPLKFDPINCVQHINPSFQKARYEQEQDKSK